MNFLSVSPRYYLKLSNITVIQTTYVVLKFLVATLRETSEINNTFYLTQCIQNISTSNQYKKLVRYFILFFHN